MSSFNDIFLQDAFSFVSLQAAVNKLPYSENYLGGTGLFEATTAGVETNTVVIDETNGRLSILNSSARGTPPQRYKKKDKAKSRAVIIPHFDFEDSITAASLLGKRNPGENILQSVARQINETFIQMRQDIDDTWETHRLGALRGELLDGDGSVIEDYFSLFNLTQITFNFALGSASTEMRSRTVAAIRAIEAELGGVKYTGIEALCSAEFFDKFIEHAMVRDTFLNFQAASVLREDIRFVGFPFGGVVWREYRGMQGLANDIGRVAPGEAIMYPVGVPGMYRRYFAPGDFMETVGQLGQPMYAKVAPDLKYQKHVDTLMETNPLYINTRPSSVLRITMT